MRSSAARDELSSPPFEPKPENLEIFLAKGEQFKKLNLKQIFSQSVRFICHNPFVFRFKLKDQSQVYFTASDDIYQHLKAKDKTVRWIFELFETWRQVLILKGFPKDLSIYKWRIHDVALLMSALEVLPGSKVHEANSSEEFLASLREKEKQSVMNQKQAH